MLLHLFFHLIIFFHFCIASVLLCPLQSFFFLHFFQLPVNRIILFTRHNKSWHMRFPLICFYLIICHPPRGFPACNNLIHIKKNDKHNTCRSFQIHSCLAASIFQQFPVINFKGLAQAHDGYQRKSFFAIFNIRDPRP